MKKFLCILMAALSIFSLILPAFAADESTDSQINADYDISKSTISEDFAKAFGGELKVEDYPYDSSIGTSEEDNDDIFLITCLEYKVDNRYQSEMYFYLYNPTRKNIDLDSGDNTVRAEYHSNDLEIVYDDYTLTYVNSENEGVLMKFKVKGFFSNLAFDQDERSYMISGIELVTEGKSSAIEYGVGKQFTFRDNKLGFVMQSWSEIETVETSVKHTYYRYYGEDENTAVDLQSVYFNLPNEIIDEYGYLDSITAMWEECQMYPVLVTDNEELSELFSEAVLTDVPSSFKASFGYAFSNLMATSNVCFHGFNADYIWYYIGLCRVLNRHKYLGGSFYDEDGWKDPREKVVSSEELMALMDSYGWDDWNFKSVDKSNYGDNAKSFKVVGSLNDDSYMLPNLMLSLMSNGTFRDFVEGEKYYPEFYSLLREVEPTDIAELKNEEFSKKYFVDVDDVKAIKSSYNENETMYLLQYAVTDYSVYEDVDFDDVEIELENEDGEESQALVAHLTAIRNFDLIQAGFEKNGVYTILPIVSSRTNFIPDITAPNSNKDGPPWWLIVLIICVVILVIVKIYKSYKKSRREKKFDERFLK